MKKYVFLFTLCFLVFIPALKVYALSAPITSPFGWRTHPIFGTQRFHSGVDLGVDIGTPLTAILPGTVEAAEWMGGYGYAVLIDHGGGVESLFGHCSQLFVVPGQTVSAGMLVAASGNTGYSNGPHVHVEVRMNGSPVDPLPLLLQCGWDVTGDTVPAGGDGYTNSDYDEMLWNFGDFVDVAKMYREIINDFSGYWSKGLGYLQEDLSYYLTVFMTIDLVLSLLFFSMKQSNSGFFDFMVRKVLQYGLVMGLVSNWKSFINDFILSFVTDVAITAGGGGDYIAKNMSDPSLIVQKGVTLIQPVFAYISTYSGVHMVANLHQVIYAMILGFGILTCFTIIGLQMLITYLQFYITCLFAVVTVPTGVLSHTQFVGGNGIAAVINVGLKLMVMTFIIAVIVFYIRDYSSLQYDPIVYSRFLIVSIALTLMVSFVPRKINSLLSVSFKFPDFIRG